MSIPAWTVDREGTFTWVNDAFDSTFGNRVGEHYSSTVAPEYRAEVERQRGLKLAGAPVTDYEIEALLPDGRRVRVETSSVPVDPDNMCAGFFGVSLKRGVPTESRGSGLTSRQLEVLGLLAGGSSTDQIAASLHLSTHTVRNYVRQILRVLHAHSRLEAVVVARSEGLIAD
ncbi:MAG: PAS domain-containing protein [Actinobacteria bacterium]|nr:PAS domain-containing protein [Actinomycetota bacterium]MBV8598768.1 PAS domain-containing protein [Actinomycetota bacterium]